MGTRILAVVVGSLMSIWLAGRTAWARQDEESAPPSIEITPEPEELPDLPGDDNTTPEDDSRETEEAVPAGAADVPAAPPAPPAEETHEAMPVAAMDAAANFVGLLDGAKYAQSWDVAAVYFRHAVTKEQWQTSVQAVRQPLGPMTSRRLKSAQRAATLPGAPDGDYLVIQYETSFANKASAIETVTPMRQTDGSWAVAGYFIK